MKNFFLLCVALLMSFQLIAQQRRVSGTVLDSKDKSAMIGANIMEKGTLNGTITDINGNFSLNVTSSNSILVVSSIGYKTLEVVVGNRSILNLEMDEETELLDELVVIGYGTMKKSDISGASVSVSEDAIKGSVITNLDQALQGRASGVSSVMTSGAPGSSTSIRIRGQATINANAEPLYVIDGVIVQGGGSSGASFGLGDALGNSPTSTISPLSTINPADILSMEILKDASATAIYGAQGANGVVLITTKRGQAGEAKFSYEGLFGLQRQSARLEMMNLREFAEFSNSVSDETNALDSRPEFQDPSLLGVGTNWQDAIFRIAPMHQHQLSAQGGTDAIRYYISGSFLNQDGTIIGTTFKRTSFRVNLDSQLKKWLKLGVSAMYSNTDERLGLADSEEGIVNYSLLTPPDIPIYDLDGSYASVIREGYTRINPIAMALDEDILLERNKLNGSIFADITPLKNLVWHTELGFDIGGSRGERFEPAVRYGNWSRDKNMSSIQRNNNNFWQLKNYLTYTGKKDKHDYTLMLGQELWESQYEFQSVSTTDLPSNDIHNPSLGKDPRINSGFGSSAMASFFGRATYNYDNRYMGTYTYRQDGSSNFGPKNRWAGFNAFAVSWRFTNEEFFESATNILNDGKLRVGWGQTGNSNIGGYRWGASISRMPSGLGLGYRQSNIANPYIQWETQEQWNFGLDLSFLQNRIGLVVDLYDKTSKDMLMQLQLPSYMGTRGNVSSALSAPYGNYGTINNKGFEFTITTNNLTGGLTWDTQFQMSFNKNKLVALDGTDSGHIEGYGQWSDVVTITRVGEPLYNFYGYKVAGVYKDFDDINNSPKPAKYPSNGVFNRANTVWPGDLKYEDISGPDGKPDGIIDTYDRTNIGSPMPKFTFGMTNTFKYQNLDLSIFINGSYGNKIFNYMDMNLSGMTSIWNNQLKKVTERARLEPIDGNKAYPTEINGVTVNNWFEDVTNVEVTNPRATIPRAIANDPNDNNRISDRYIEDGSYLRIKNITLGYTIPTHLTRKLLIENIRVYTNIQNLYTFTKYTGYDPEIGASTSNANVYGLDNGRYPSPQNYTFGLNITF
ncbi:MAG: TonB-dependent receptor [Dysgonamonadaceae bacterium]|nr:TonB-dependent receptor [Dysgonamonadaceae bacterium]MDD3355354.1 TonB-dependent receptor [Dysgonamonadaceae bacterium]MDD3726707.1 TonB-dependent receptor [Dysgonamonadaceae bacterium]MDD4246040.1 TonB-dependent receptor [Dysgonamonadaceae bacterium]MDD4604953.1 TonB-dependent receptor [Dysgonamonadaceae bacterium]